MKSNRPLLALIPARGGSKRLPDKNIRPLAGKPLIVYSIEAALRCPSVSRVLVSTDSPRIRDVALAAGAAVPFLRPEALADDQSPTIDLILHALHFLLATEKTLEPYLVLLQPTSPLRTALDVEQAFGQLRSTSADSIVSVVQKPLEFKQLVTIATEVIKPFAPPSEPTAPLYRLNGAIYISRTATILATRRLLGTTVIPYLMPELRSVDIDTIEDFELAEILIGKAPGPKSNTSR